MKSVWLAPLVSFLLILMMVLHNNANAGEPQRWVGTPVFYSKFVPKEVTCEYQKAARQGTCGIKGYSETGTVGLTTAEVEPKIEAVQVRLYMEITCVEGKCKTPYGEPAGIVDTQQTSYWTVPTGFYLYPVDGKVKAYKAGNGPLAKDYPIRSVWILPEYNDMPDGYFIPEDKERLTFNVWCNDGNECSYMGKEINYAQLNRYVPKRLSTMCDIRFCYDTNKLIVGLNPKHI